MSVISATFIDADHAELHSDGAPGVLLCEYSGVTGEWSPVSFRLHDGGELLPTFGTSLNDEALAALEGE